MSLVIIDMERLRTLSFDHPQPHKKRKRRYRTIEEEQSFEVKEKEEDETWSCNLLFDLTNLAGDGEIRYHNTALYIYCFADFYIPSINPNVGEASAARMIIEEAISMGLKKILVAGDSSLVAQTINNPTESLN